MWSAREQATDMKDFEHQGELKSLPISNHPHQYHHIPLYLSLYQSSQYNNKYTVMILFSENLFYKLAHRNRIQKAI
jgi:hypothetical protein